MTFYLLFCMNYLYSSAKFSDYFILSFIFYNFYSYYSYRLLNYFFISCSYFFLWSKYFFYCYTLLRSFSINVCSKRSFNSATLYSNILVYRWWASLIRAIYSLCFSVIILIDLLICYHYHIDTYSRIF